MTDQEEHIETTLNKIRAIYQEFCNTIAKQVHGPGGRTPITEITSQMASKFDMTAAQLYPLLTPLLKDFPGIISYKGRYGGIERIPPNE